MLMIHKYIPGTNPRRPTLVLFHGTGGNENDLLSIAQMIDHEASVLALRGDVSEFWMNRFFKRLAEGVFDYNDICMRVDALDAFLNKACEQYQLDRQDLLGVGYSNGANMIAQMMLKKPMSFRQAILMHPMDIDPKVIPTPIEDVDILVTAGTEDPIVTQAQTNQLVHRFQTQKATVELAWFKHGHQLSSDEIQTVIKWYQKHIIDPEQFRD